MQLKYTHRAFIPFNRWMPVYLCCRVYTKTSAVTDRKRVQFTGDIILKLLLLQISLWMLFIGQPSLAAATDNPENASFVTGAFTPGVPAPYGYFPERQIGVPRFRPGISLYGGYWSDKLALTPYREFLAVGEQDNLKRLVVHLLNQSFDLAGKSAEETSQQITDAVQGGISLSSNVSLTLQTPAFHHFFTRVSTDIDMETRLPEAPFLLIFSEHEGLRRGTDLPLTHLGLRSCVTTSLTATKHREIDAPGILESVNGSFGRFTMFDRIFLQYGVTVMLGHAFIEMQTKKGGIHMNEDGSELYMDADLHVRSSGMRIRNDSRLSFNPGEGFPLSGAGAGGNIGVQVSGAHTVVGIGLYNAGALVWRGVRKTELRMRTSNISVSELIESGYNLFNQETGGYFPELDTGDIMEPALSFVRSFPARYNILFSYRFDVDPRYKMIRTVLLKSLTSTLEYRQNLAPWPGRSMIPGILFTNDLLFLDGVLPFRFGWFAGENRGVTSLLAAGIHSRYFSISAGFEAVGTPYWFPKRGCTVYVGISGGI